MASTRISLRQVLDLQVPFTWQEAVAVAHEVAILSVVHASMNPKPPRIDADSCFITRRGDVELPETTDVEQPEAPLQILRELLTGRDTPADLEALAYGRASTRLSDDLALFSRPNRRAEIAELAIRAIAAESELVEPVAPAEHAALSALPVLPLEGTPSAVLSGDEELARLRDHVGSQPVAETPDPAKPPSGIARFVDLRVAAGVALLLVTVTAWWAWSVSPPNAPAAQAATLPQALAPIPLDPSWHAVGLRAEDIELGRRPVAAAERTLLATASSRATTVGSALVAAPADLLSNGAVAPASEPAPDTDVSDTATVDRLFEDVSVYSWTNPTVVPPMMRFPRMPRSSFPAPGEAITGPYFEALVSQSGAVEAVRLRGREEPGQTFYHHSMMLAAAKAWQFAPARLEGRPVRYVVRVVVAP